MSKFDKISHPNKADFEQGREDGSQTNPYREPNGRSGDALEAYDNGFKFGGECMDEYYDGEDC